VSFVLTVPVFYFQEAVMKFLSPQSMLNAALGAMVVLFLLRSFCSLKGDVSLYGQG